MKIAVFGANGAIGSHFIKLALKDGHDLHLYSRKKIDLPDPLKTKLFTGELSDFEARLDGFSFKIDIRYLQVDGFLTP